MSSAPQSSSARLATEVWGWTMAAIGAAMIVLNPTRFAGPAWLAFQQLPGWPRSVGFVLLAGAAVILVGDYSGHFKTRNVGIRCFQVVCLGFVGAFTYAAFYDPRAGATGIILFAATAIQLEIVRRLRRKGTDHDAAAR